MISIHFESHFSDEILTIIGYNVIGKIELAEKPAINGTVESVFNFSIDQKIVIDS